MNQSIVKTARWAIWSMALLAVFSTARAQTLSVTLTSPVNKTVYVPCSDIVFHAEPNPTTDIKNVSFFRNDVAFATDSKTPFEYTWKKAYPGYYKIHALVTDKAGNTATSDPIWISVGNITPGDKIGNGQFLCNVSTPWTLNVNSAAAATMSIDTTSDYLESPDSTVMVVQITNPGGADWHVQLHQPFPIQAGHTYILTFAAGSDVPKPMSFEVQGNSASYTIHWSQNISLDYAGYYGPYIFECTVDDPTAYFRFCVAGNNTTFYVDDVQFVDPDVTSVEENQTGNPAQARDFLMSQNYPNPFNSSTTIEYRLPEAAQVSIEVFNLQGQKIKTLMNEHQASGTHHVVWNGMNELSETVTSGLYVYQIKARTAEKTLSIQNKILLVE